LVKNPDPVNILLVDDQPAKLLSYEVILDQLGETLIKANSAHEALAHLLKHDIAVVLIDVQMPDLDGFELAAMIREHPRFQQTALIFVSAIHLSDLDRLRGYEAGAVDYVPVPVVPEVLRAKVRVFAELHRKTRALERLNADLELRVAERTADLEQSRAALQAFNEELEIRIDQRTREREQALAQLFEAQKIDTIGQLTGGVAHDFNNLLMAMLGSLEILKKRLKDDPASQRLLENALKGAERGAALTQRLLAFARRQELRPEIIDVSELVFGMQDLLARAIGPGIDLHNDLPPNLPSVLIDGNQLELAVLNLAVNARDAMPNGGLLSFSAMEIDASDPKAPPGLKPGSYVRLSVVDSGEGMDETTLARAAEPFFTTKGVGKGTGLGLSMVQGLAAQSGGGLLLANEPGRGARIDLWLPQAEAGAIVRAPAVKSHAAEQVARPCTVLIVDDDALVAAGTAAMLEDLGHSVVEANSAADALTLLENGQSVDLVITDHAMPGMSGTDLARALRIKYPGLPIVIASGYAEIPANSSADLHLPKLAKPFAQSDLARMVAEHAIQPAAAAGAAA
jgi:signal transduction histidine kinase